MTLPTMALFTRVKLSVQLTEFIKVLKPERSQSAINDAYKKAKKTELEPICIDYQPGKTKKVAVHEITLLTVRIKPTKAVTSFWVNIKPTRLITPLWCLRSLFLQYALSLQDPLPLLQEYTKSTEFPKTTKKLQLTWPRHSSQ